jgi:pimeloyl-ACP methyl ester carboxylesterase
MRGGRSAPPARWTFRLIPGIARAVREREGRPDLAYDLIGHSAGAMFLMRAAALTDTGAGRIVVANPSTHLAPTLDRPYPEGLGGVAGLGAEALDRYLAQPLTFYVGTRDRTQAAYLATDDVVARGQRVARARGVPFRWRLVRAPGIRHDHRAMFAHPLALEALLP